MNKKMESNKLISTGTVIAGCYEDQPELMNMVDHYRIELDCMRMPEMELVVRTYYGTLEQIEGLMAWIDTDPWWREYYASTLAAWEEYQAGDQNAMHTVGWEVKRLLTPVTEICRSAYLIDDFGWAYRDKQGHVAKAGVDVLGVHQVLLWDGNKYIRCARYGMCGLKYVHPVEGWIDYDGASRGVPCMIDTNGIGNGLNRLYVVEEEYDDLDRAKWAIKVGKRLNFARITEEMLTGF